MQKWFALPNFITFYEVSQNMSIFKLVKYTIIISSDPPSKWAMLVFPMATCIPLSD